MFKFIERHPFRLKRAAWAADGNHVGLRQIAVAAAVAAAVPATSVAAPAQNPNWAAPQIRTLASHGLLMGALGAAWTAILVFEKVALGRHLGDRPALWLAVLLVVVGVQLVSLGLLGEMLARTYHESQGKATYVIKEEF